MKILGVTVNHNTSHFVELMLRTLYCTHDLAGMDLRITVLDNGSDDEHLQQLSLYLADRGIPFVQTGFDHQVALEKHGSALARFVRANQDCTHYLFLDSDMWFVQADTLPVMLGELSAAPGSCFANQARIYGYYAGRVIEGKGGIPGAGDLDGATWETVCGDPAGQPARYTTRRNVRCSPVCSLVANSQVFQKVVATVGLSPAIRFAPGEAEHYDTFGLMTHVMASHDLQFMVSAKTVYHFTETAYRPELRAVKDRDCLTMLSALRSGRGMELETFYLSDWVKQNRMNSRKI